MKTIKVAFSNMWGPAESFAAAHVLECFPCLRGHFEFVLSAEPDLAFYSAYGYVAKQFERKDGTRATRLIVTGEAGDHFAEGGKMAPGQCDQGFYDYGITCAVEQASPNHVYMPQGLLHLNLYNEGVRSLLRPVIGGKKEFFANFIYSNGSSPDRIEFFKKLQRYKRVESCGHVLPNNYELLGKAAYSGPGYRLKQAFQRRCKFSIAMENSYFPGYNTEKLTDAFVAGSVPIYRGDPRVAEVFNPKAFINWNDYGSDEATIERVIEVDQDDGLYRSYADAPPFVGNVVPQRLSDGFYLKFLEKVLA